MSAVGIRHPNVALCLLNGCGAFCGWQFPRTCFAFLPAEAWQLLFYVVMFNLAELSELTAPQSKAGQKQAAQCFSMNKYDIWCWYAAFLLFCCPFSCTCAAFEPLGDDKGLSNLSRFVSAKSHHILKKMLKYGQTAALFFVLTCVEMFLKRSVTLCLQKIHFKRY